jgi:hypothetical protein
MRYARAFRGTEQIIPNNVLTKILIDAPAGDSFGLFNPAKNGFVIPANAGGMYVVMVTGFWGAHPTGGSLRQLEIQSGTITIGGDTKPAVPGSAMWMSAFCSAVFNVGDVITVHAIQNSGGPLRFHSAAVLMYSP